LRLLHTECFKHQSTLYYTSTRKACGDAKHWATIFFTQCSNLVVQYFVLGHSKVVTHYIYSAYSPNVIGSPPHEQSASFFLFNFSPPNTGDILALKARVKAPFAGKYQYVFKNARPILKIRIGPMTMI
jgi:hypothetical protein